MRGDVSAGLPAPPAALLRASLALPGRPTSQSVTPIAVLHSSLHSIIFIIIHHAASAASRERGIQLHRIFGDDRHKTKKQREKKSLRTSGSLQARSQLTKFGLRVGPGPGGALGLGGLSGRRPLRVQVVAWGRQRGLARAPCRFAPCFAGVTWTSHESISDSNCSTSFITSFNHLHHHTPRGECRFQRERNSVASDLWRRPPQNQKAKRKEVFKDFRFSPSQIPVDEIFSFVPYGRGVAL